MDRVKQIWYLSPIRAAKVQASLRIRAVSPEPSLLAHTGSESRGTFRQKARSLAPLNVWACAVKICHDGMLKDTNSLDGAQIIAVIILRIEESDFTIDKCIEKKRTEWQQWSQIWFYTDCLDQCSLHIWQGFPRFSPVLDISVLYKGV